MEVPRLNRQTVLPEVGSAARFSPNAPQGLGPLAQGIDAATGDLAEVQARTRARDARAELLGLETSLVEWETKQIFDPASGAINKKGKDAMGLANQYLPEFDKFVEDNGKGIVDPRVAAAYAELAQGRKLNLGRSLARHEGEQREVYYDTETKAAADAMDARVARDPLNPEVVADAIARKRWSAADYAARKGLGDQASRDLELDAESGTHKAVISGLLGLGKYSDAAKYAASNKDRMNAGDLAAVDGPVREGMVRGESTRLSDELIAKHGAGGAALQAAKGIEDPDVRKATEANIRQQISDQNALRNQAEEAAADRAWDIVEKTGDWKQVPPDVWMTVPGPTRVAIRNNQDKRTRNVTDADGWRLIYDTRAMIATPEGRQKFVTDNLYETMFPHMAPGEFASMMQLQEKLRSNKASPDLWDGFQTSEQIVNSALSGMNINPKPKPKTAESERVTNFRRQVDDGIIRKQTETGHKATTAEIQAIVDELSITYAYDEHWYGDKPKYLFEADPATVMTPEEIKAATERLQYQGKPVSNYAILREFQGGK